MSQFSVKCINSSGQSILLKEGSMYYVKPDKNHHGCYKVRVAGEWHIMRKNRFEIPEQEEQMEPKRHNAHQDWKDYSFHVRSLDQVDDQAIEADLSWTNPMMIMEIEGSEHVKVFLCRTIWNKAEDAGPREVTDFHGMKLEVSTYTERLEKYLHDPSMGGYYNHMVHRRFLPGLIRLVKEIKHSPWRNPKRAKCTVKKIKI